MFDDVYFMKKALIEANVAFDMDENWEDFNKSFDNIVNNIVKGNNE